MDNLPDLINVSVTPVRIIWSGDHDTRFRYAMRPDNSSVFLYDHRRMCFIIPGFAGKPLRLQLY